MAETIVYYLKILLLGFLSYLGLAFRWVFVRGNGDRGKLWYWCYGYLRDSQRTAASKFGFLLLWVISFSLFFVILTIIFGGRLNF